MFRPDWTPVDAGQMSPAACIPGTLSISYLCSPHMLPDGHAMDIGHMHGFALPNCRLINSMLGEKGEGRLAGHLGSVNAQILELVLDQAAVTIGHIGDLLDPCQIHRGVRLRSSKCPRQALRNRVMCRRQAGRGSLVTLDVSDHCCSSAPSKAQEVH